MRGHDKAEVRRDYDDYDEYETGDEREEEMAESAEEKEPEDPKPTKEELDYLKTRERLKERIRQKYKKENATAFGHSTHSLVRNGTPTIATFGCFFGPSQPVIAARVIEESRSIRETQHIAAKTQSSSSALQKKHVLTTPEMKTNAHDRPRKVVNELKTKVQALKNMRDYSFLLSDDVDLPAPAKEPAAKNVSVPNNDVRPAQAQRKTMISTSMPGGPVSGGHETRNALSRNQHMQTKVGNQKGAPLSRPKASSLADPRKSLGVNAGNGPGRPTVPKASSHAPAQGVVTKKTPPTAAKKTISSLERRPSSTKPHSSTQNHYSEQRREAQGVVGKAKLMSKEPVSSSKPQMSKPSKQIQQHSMHEHRPRKKPIRRYSDEEDGDDDAAINMIRQMFRYNPNKYAGVDDDDSDMEANFDDIIKEENRSSRIARQEDEEQLRLIEEEERRERMRKEAKKRKLMQR